MSALGLSVAAWLNPTLVRAIVCKLHMNAKIFGLQFSDYLLKCIAVFSRNAYHIALNRCLHLCFRIFDEPDDLFCLFLRDSLLNLNVLSDGAAGRWLHVSITQGL